MQCNSRKISTWPNWISDWKSWRYKHNYKQIRNMVTTLVCQNIY